MPPKAPKEHFTILYFASASSFTRKTSEFLPAPLECSRLFDALEQRYAGFKAKVLCSCLVTVNLEYVDVTQVSSESVVESDNPSQSTGNKSMIEEGDEVAIIPPVSSG